jgi:hypothetical protein
VLLRCCFYVMLVLLCDGRSGRVRRARGQPTWHARLKRLSHYVTASRDVIAGLGCGDEA